MSTNSYKSNTFKKRGEPEKKTKSKFKFDIGFLKDRKIHLAFGLFLLLSAIFLFIAFFAYLFTGRVDQSVVTQTIDEDLKETVAETRNWFGYAGAYLAHYFIFKWFGLAAFFLPPLMFLIGFKVVFERSLISISRFFWFSVFFTFWLGLMLGYVVLLTDDFNYFGYLSGGIGYELAVLVNGFFGWGTFIVLLFAFLVFNVFFFNITNIAWLTKKEVALGEEEEKLFSNMTDSSEVDEIAENESEDEEVLTDWAVKSEASASPSMPLSVTKNEEEASIKETKLDLQLSGDLGEEVEDEVEDNFKIEASIADDKPADKLENYDPTLDLSSYKYPTVDLLNEYGGAKVQVTREELEANKNKIVETLINFKIGIQEIKATIGPTVTLYEIVPDAGVKISKIKNLEDDIALSLAALGIRIIAPIPGKGTIGIEVPNKNKEMVSMRSVLATEKFMKSDKELPVVLGKTISNEIFVADLAKMPHLLMAGATGQGKSVGLNVILASLIYKKHPSQLKFVLVDPKKVELTLFNKLERHFLAKLPDSEEAIITDTKKVIYTLNSLCIEMDQRYDLLKDAGCRNLKEYNAKFVQRKLNPEHGHKFLPYIVLVIDELADLMMTAGKEIETPIARLAQLARAIGIHLVVATQRPSVNVITGIIKANFPARLSFRVTSKIDSRTILDAGGADQLIGQGDMLLSMGSEIIRLQCAFIDTPEVDAVCDFVGNQRGYSTAYLLPEFVGDEGGDGIGDVDLSDRDAYFEDAARLIVNAQQGSTSLIQRKLKLGYNRAGRIIDQLEAAGIVGPFEGSKAREVLITDEGSLEQLLSELNNKY